MNAFRRFALASRWPWAFPVRQSEYKEWDSIEFRPGLVYFLATAPGIFASVYRIDRDGARQKRERWARLRAFRNACWICLSIHPLCRFPRLAEWTEPRWHRERRLRGAA